MRRHAGIPTAVLLAGLLAAAASCNTDGCLDNQSSIPLAGFYSSETSASISLNILQVHGVGAPGDSVLLRPGTAVSSVYLPMRSTHSSVQWCFHYEQGDLADPAYNDTITFDYTSRPYFASEECGAMYEYTIDRTTVTNHLIDSVVVTEPVITNTDVERIRIYFRTDNSGGDDNTDNDNTDRR
ncbi:MAG: hypothetical protein K2J38_02420 [Muribaculaceae bacterium]|nr:hypothetical protein [Muribaculaceae bacterium]